MGYYSRYSSFVLNNKSVPMPFIKIGISDSDKYESYKVGQTRFDIISQTYYGDPSFGWLITLANPQYSMEFDFNDGDIIRVPFPLNMALNTFETQIEQFKIL